LKDKIPTGYDANPSSWRKRAPLLVLAAAGFLIAFYLGLYQLHVFSKVWEPFFGNGTNAIVNSSFSRSLPVPDALLGAFGYLSDMILVSVGSENRWQSKPWIVILYAMLISLMGIVSVLLLILQPFVLHAWCTLCILSAILSLSMVVPAFIELVAALQYIKNEREKGKSIWKAVWAD
jgi:biotin transporter BioY